MTPAYVVEFYPERTCAAHKRTTPGSAHCADPPCRDRHYTIDGEREINGLPIISATTITREIGDQFGVAAWWGQRVGVEGTLRLVREQGFDADEESPESWVESLKEFRLTTNYVRDVAAERGTNVHQEGEDWANGKGLPQGDEYSAGLRNLITTEQLEPLVAEVPVGSQEYAYAGTPDLLARFPKFDAIGLVDYKSKSRALKPGEKAKAYDQHHIQVRLYEDARIEMGGRPSDFQAICNIYPDGTYALIQGRATTAQARNALAAYRSLTELRETVKAAA